MRKTVIDSQELMDLLKSLNYIELLKTVSEDYEEDLERLLSSYTHDVYDFITNLVEYHLDNGNYQIKQHDDDSLDVIINGQVFHFNPSQIIYHEWGKEIVGNPTVNGTEFHCNVFWNNVIE